MSDFYEWACEQSQPVFISEYSMPEDRFKCVFEIEKTCHLAARGPATLSRNFLFQ